MTAALEVSNLTKTYRSWRGKRLALENVTLSAESGEILGLLGPNGAGKTTLLRIVAGLASSDRGTVCLFGEPVQRGNLPRLLHQVGVLIERPAFEPRWSAVRNLEWLGRYAGLEGTDIPALLEYVGLEPRDGRPVKTYSLGMRQRLGLAAALMKAPRLLLLDEPTNGLDPLGIAELRDRLRALAASRGMSILVASHLLDEMQRICDRVAVIANGQLRVEGRLPQLLAGDRRVLRWSVELPLIALDVLRSAGFEASCADGMLEIAGSPDPRDVSAALLGAGLYASTIESDGRTLEEVYKRYAASDGGCEDTDELQARGKVR